jgi:CheY-like chemotaxis protein
LCPSRWNHPESHPPSLRRIGSDWPPICSRELHRERTPLNRDNSDIGVRETDPSREAPADLDFFSEAFLGNAGIQNLAIEPRQTILLVEDDAFLRPAIGEALESRGYSVLVAACAPEAKEIHRQCSETVDLLLTDIVMPGTNGCDLANDLLAASPDLCILLMSGYAEPPPTPFPPSDRMRYIGKPFFVDQLLLMVSEALTSQKVPPSGIQ